MRLRPATLLPTFAFVFALAAFAQKPPPANLEPLPEAPPPPPEIANDPELEPQVTIVRRPTETIEEYRVKGRLTMIKVIPKTGRPYYLVADGSTARLSVATAWIRDSKCLCGCCSLFDLGTVLYQR